MLDDATIEMRLREMRQNPNHNIYWDETCEGQLVPSSYLLGQVPEDRNLRRDAR